jgi:hypothetical protein
MSDGWSFVMPWFAPFLLQFSFADRFKVGKAKPAKKSSKMIKVSRKCE